MASQTKVTGGDKLESALLYILKNVTINGKGAKVDVGFLENATYPDGKPVAMIAAIQEFGAPGKGIPPRPFFRNMVAEKVGEWPKAVADLLKENDYDAAKTLGQVGEGIKGQLQQSIVDLSAPALSPVTLMLRKMKSLDPGLKVTGKTVGEAAAKVAAGESYGGVSTKPLVETGVLLNAVDYHVTSST